MKETRIKISSIINNQLPQFVEEEFPLVSEFLSQNFCAGGAPITRAPVLRADFRPLPRPAPPRHAFAPGPRVPLGVLPARNPAPGAI